MERDYNEKTFPPRLAALKLRDIATYVPFYTLGEIKENIKESQQRMNEFYKKPGVMTKSQK